MPSGDHTGPQPPRESIDSSGTGAYHFSSPPVAENVSTWLVPSRKRLVNGAIDASAIRFPSADHVGVPGCGSVSWIFVTAPLATSSTDIPGPMPQASTSFGPSGSRNVSTMDG